MSHAVQTYTLRTGNTAFKTSLALDLSIDVALVGRELMPSRTFIVRIEASRDCADMTHSYVSYDAFVCVP